ncbi:MAG TPA: hypothetical protein VMV58_01290 [Desulfosporosinus sp.]|nr:hypothetical protein [Desulfosporosinus sp.]
MIKYPEEIRMQSIEDRLKKLLSSLAGATAGCGCFPIIPAYYLIGDGVDFLQCVEILKSMENGTYIYEESE